MPALPTDGNLSALTREHVIPVLRDNIFRDNPLLARLRQNGLMVEDGLDIQVPILFARNTKGGSYSTSTGLNIDKVEIATRATQNWKRYYKPVTIDGIDEITNGGGQNTIINHLQAQFMVAQRSMGDDIMDGIWSDGTGNSNAVITGLQAYVSDTTSYGGISRASYTWWQANVDGNGGTARMLSLALIREMIGTCTEGSDKPTLLVGQVEHYNRVWNLLEAKQQYQMMTSDVGTGVGAVGYKALMVDDIPLIVDSRTPETDATHTSLFCLNERYLRLAVHPDRDFAQTDFVRPRDADSRTALILWAGNLIGDNPRMQGRIDDLDPALTS